MTDAKIRVVLQQGNQTRLLGTPPRDLAAERSGLLKQKISELTGNNGTITLTEGSFWGLRRVIASIESFGRRKNFRFVVQGLSAVQLCELWQSATLLEIRPTVVEKLIGTLCYELRTKKLTAGTMKAVFDALYDYKDKKEVGTALGLMVRQYCKAKLFNDEGYTETELATLDKLVGSNELINEAAAEKIQKVERSKRGRESNVSAGIDRDE